MVNSYLESVKLLPVPFVNRYEFFSKFIMNGDDCSKKSMHHNDMSFQSFARQIATKRLGPLYGYGMRKCIVITYMG